MPRCGSFRRSAAWWIGQIVKNRGMLPWCNSRWSHNARCSVNEYLSPFSLFSRLVFRKNRLGTTAWKCYMQLRIVAPTSGVSVASESHPIGNNFLFSNPWQTVWVRHFFRWESRSSIVCIGNPKTQLKRLCYVSSCFETKPEKNWHVPFCQRVSVFFSTRRLPLRFGFTHTTKAAKSHGTQKREFQTFKISGFLFCVLWFVASRWQQFFSKPTVRHQAPWYNREFKQPRSERKLQTWRQLQTPPDRIILIEKPCFLVNFVQQCFAKAESTSKM